jgi:V-type H+-transporting ATPase subunit C
MRCIAEPTDQYLCNFSWNKLRYRADKSLGELLDTLQKVSYKSFACAVAFCRSFGRLRNKLLTCEPVQELGTVDNDVKVKFNQYNTVKTSLASLQRRQT